ncbi:CPBP family intramembrane glutamic endopeptidase [Segetibacter koreensis]|uniref:CPBP family intramembrane glutamic endopeptidase n=1 Tax=Segetibacter koreensis TaxID=398037 RepID=UPI00037770EF|nr:CPBP family intramembrane glutamic endopeptidase [Segetibacter koreensis]
MRKLNIYSAVIFYFIVAYAIAWGGILYSFGSEGFKLYQGEGVLSGSIDQKFLYVWIAMLAGPSIAGILLTAITDGKKGVRHLLASISIWKVEIKWYAFALFIFPVVLLFILASFSVFSSKFYPSTMITIGLAAGLIGGFFEEIGWTGFALPKLQLIYTPLKAGIILGVVHAFWHLLGDLWGGVIFYKELYEIHFFLWILCLTAFRLVASWIYNNTGSLLLAQLTHASFTGSQLMFSPSALNPTESIVWYAAFVIVLWIIVIAAFLGRKGKTSISVENRIKSISHVY